MHSPNFTEKQYNRIMHKLKKLFKGLFLLIKKPSLLNEILESDLVWQKKVDNQTLPVVEIENLIPDFKETLSVFSFLGGGSLPTDIMLLKGLARQIKNCNYFEIGTWRGESVVNVSETAKECYTLNLSKKEILDLNMPEEYAELHGFFSKNKENIQHLYGNSLTYNFKKLNKKFDLIFIDGNHKYDFVKNDTKKIIAHLTHKNTIIVWHDYAYNPEKIRSEVLKGILDGLPKKMHQNLYHVSNTMCAIYYPKKVQSTKFTSIKKPTKFFKIRAEIIKP